MRAQPKKSPAFPSLASVRERVNVKPKAVNVDAERKAANAASAQYTKWLTSLANEAVTRTGAQRKAAKSVDAARAPVVLNIPPSERGLVLTAYLLAKGDAPNAAFCGALAGAISERLAKLGSSDFVGVSIDRLGASVSVRISDKEIPKVVEVEKPKAVSVPRGDTDLGTVSMAAKAHAAVIEACISAIENGLAGPQLQRAFGMDAKIVQGFFAGDISLERKAAFKLVEQALVVVRESETLKRPVPVGNGEIQRAVAGLQSAQRSQST